jgi:hypothetical protein
MEEGDQPHRTGRRSGALEDLGQEQVEEQEPRFLLLLEIQVDPCSLVSRRVGIEQQRRALHLPDAVGPDDGIDPPAFALGRWFALVPRPQSDKVEHLLLWPNVHRFGRQKLSDARASLLLLRLLGWFEGFVVLVGADEGRSDEGGELDGCGFQVEKVEDGEEGRRESGREVERFRFLWGQMVEQGEDLRRWRALYTDRISDTLNSSLNDKRERERERRRRTTTITLLATMLLSQVFFLPESQIRRVKRRTRRMPSQR